MSVAKAKADSDLYRNVNSISILNDDCLEKIFSYLDLMSQIQLSKTCNRLRHIFIMYAGRRYKHIDKELANYILQNFGYKIMNELLLIIGEQVLSYVTPKYVRLQHNARDLMDNRQLSIVAKHCPNLECYKVSGRFVNMDLCWKTICQLPKLKHLYIKTTGQVHLEFLEALESKPGAKLQILSLKGITLSKPQVQRICGVTSLKKLRLSCEEVPIKLLLRLQHLECLDLTMPSITNEQLMALVKDLSQLQNLNLRQCSLITPKFLVKLRDWLTKTNECVPKLWLYVQGLDVNWESLSEPVYLKSKHLVMITEIAGDEPVLLQNNIKSDY